MIVHEADLESDMSRFHRIDDITQIPFARLVRLAERIWVYGGVMQRARTTKDPQWASQPQQPATGFSLATDPDGNAVGYRGRKPPTIQPISAMGPRTGGSIRLVDTTPAA